MSNKKKYVIGNRSVNDNFCIYELCGSCKFKDSLFDVFDSGITMFDAENAEIQLLLQQRRLQQRKQTEATTAPTATAEAAEATTAPTEAPTAAPTVDPSWDGSVDISENFDGESAVDGNGYKWDVVIGNDWGGTNKALSLTANDGKSILKVPNGNG